MVNASAAAAAARLLWPLAIDCVYQTAAAAPFDFPVDPIRFFTITVENQPPPASIAHIRFAQCTAAAIYIFISHTATGKLRMVRKDREKNKGRRWRWWW